MERLKQWLISASRSPRVLVVLGWELGLRVETKCGIFPSETEKESQRFDSFYPQCGGLLSKNCT